MFSCALSVLSNDFNNILRNVREFSKNIYLENLHKNFTFYDLLPEIIVDVSSVVGISYFFEIVYFVITSLYITIIWPALNVDTQGRVRTEEELLYRKSAAMLLIRNAAIIGAHCPP